MKAHIIALSIILTGCSTTTTPPPHAWHQVENLTGEPLIAALIKSGDIEISEVHERRRHLRLEIAALDAKVNRTPDEDSQLAMKKAAEMSFTRFLDERALEKKMALWKDSQKSK